MGIAALHPSYRTARILRPLAAQAKMSKGNQTHRISDQRTATPRALRKRERPSGATSIGWNGTKNRSSRNGQRKATPSPPFVNASSKPCEAIDNNMNQNTIEAVKPRSRINIAAIMAMKIANNNEWLNPRWPKPSAYATPKRKASTSRSGSTETSAPTIKSRPEIFSRPNATVRAIGTAG